MLLQVKCFRKRKVCLVAWCSYSLRLALQYYIAYSTRGMMHRLLNQVSKIDMLNLVYHFWSALCFCSLNTPFGSFSQCEQGQDYDHPRTSDSWTSPIPCNYSVVPLHGFYSFWIGFLLFVRCILQVHTIRTMCFIFIENMCLLFCLSLHT